MIVNEATITAGTHQVTNQPPPLQNYNAYESDAALHEGLLREGAVWGEPRVREFGRVAASERLIELGYLANRYTPVLKTHDRCGHRIDEVEYHPSWHELMAIGIGAEVHALPWNDSRPGAHVVRAVLHYLLDQAETGIGCPITMTFAVVPSLRQQPDVAEEWIPRVTSKEYDPRFIPSDQKKGCLMGMAMTEKQGGSDVRANTTRARPLGNGGPGAEYELTGHKWFCSAPMCDAFLTLAHTDAGLTCFLVPRWLPDGTRNAFFIQRLKDKLGNRSNASSEIEYDGTWAVMVGEEGRGVATIIEMVSHTRLDCVIGSAAVMRQAVAQATHHVRHRSAFGKLLRDQPLMKNVLADLCIESEAATTVMLRLARAYDEAQRSDVARHFARIATAVGKYWVCKRTPLLVYEALECHGGNGYVEESIMSRLYREAPLSSIWEGSGNVICLDVLRAMNKEPESVESFLEELHLTKGAERRIDAAVEDIKGELRSADNLETRARRVVEKMALAFQASLLVRHAPTAVAHAFCASRLGDEHGYEYGTLPAGTDFDAIIERATPILGG